VLGPVEIHTDDGRIVTLPRRQERCLLGILLLEAGHVVPLPRLVGLLWDGDPPARAAQALRTYVARIRSLLARAGAVDHGVRLVSAHGGYILDVDTDAVDAHRFRSLLKEAATADLATRDRILQECLALWHGPALDRAASDEQRDRLCADLTELRVRAVEEYLATELDLGRHRAVLPELIRYRAEHPDRERLVELHMLALYRDGRTADALEAYERFRVRLADRLGADPGSALQHLHRAILRGEPLAAPRPSAAAAPADFAPVPAQLPADLPSFVGRAEPLHELDGLLADSGDTVLISTVSGTAGVGKTALAVHWAHQVRHRFPDGQLYINLRGFDPAGTVVPPEAAVRRFLEALNVPPQRIPADADAQTDLYRTLVADKRMLVLLDNARDAGQVRPLLPGTPGCLVVVTSRNQLTSLIAIEGARSITLHLLTTEESTDLLARRIGTGRVTAEPDAVAQVIAYCARLPLALAIVAAHAVGRRDLPLAGLTAELRDARDRLDALSGDDPQIDVRTVFSWSYRTLSTDAARLFRLLGRHPGPDLSAPAATSLAAVPPARAWTLLAELVQANLLTEHAPGRYTFHDLLRAYAAGLADLIGTGQQRRAATHRLLDHYLHTANVAAQLIDPQRDHITVPPARTGVVAETIKTNAEAMAWLTVEHQVLLAAIDHATDAGFDRHAWQLAWTLVNFLDRRGRWHEAATIQTRALVAARRLDDRPGQVFSHRRLAAAHTRLGRYDTAVTHFQQALDLCGELGDDIGEARVRLGLAEVLERQGRHRDALAHAERALDVFHAADHQTGEALALNQAGWLHALLGEHRQALTQCRQALPMHQQVGNRRAEAATWDTLGFAHHHLGHYTRAVSCYQRAVNLYRTAGEAFDTAAVLRHLGDTHLANGSADTARDTWRQALTILTELGHPDADTVHATLNRLDITTPLPQHHRHSRTGSGP